MRGSGFFRRLAEYAVSTVFAFAALVCLYGLIDRDGRADVAVVLGNEVYGDGTPSPRLAARLDRAVSLFREKKCGMVIVSGGKSASGQDEASAMGRYLVLRGVPERKIIHDPGGVNTWETARFVSAFLRRYRMDSVIVVSQHFHIARSEMAMRFMGVQAVGSASPRYFEWRDLYSAFRELPGIVWYCMKALFFL